jgi:hypothetical protein
VCAPFCAPSYQILNGPLECVMRHDPRNYRINSGTMQKVECPEGHCEAARVSHRVGRSKVISCYEAGYDGF